MQEGCGGFAKCMDARGKRCANACDFCVIDVARATVFFGDDLRYCAQTLSGTARRSVLRQACSGHVDVNCARVPAYALKVKIQYY